MPPKPKYEMEFTTYCHRWKDLSLPLKRMAGDSGVQLEIVETHQGLFRLYHCVATGKRTGLEQFKDRWTGGKMNF